MRAGVTFYRDSGSGLYVCLVGVLGYFVGQLVQATPFDLTAGDIVVDNLYTSDGCGEQINGTGIYQVGYGGTITIRRARPECRCA